MACTVNVSTRLFIQAIFETREYLYPLLPALPIRSYPLLLPYVPPLLKLLLDRSLLSSDLFDSSPDDEYLLPDKVLVPTAEADAEDDRPYRDGELGDEYDEEIDDEYILVILLLTEFHNLFVIC